MRDNLRTVTFRQNTILLLCGILLPVLFCFDLAVGGVHIPLDHVIGALTGGDCPETESRIVLNIRLIKGIVAILTGAALSVSGLQMQTLFRNPLAGPYVLGISSGASLGVALFIFGSPLFALPSEFAELGIAGAAWIGAAAILTAVAILGRRVKDIMVVLILGMMFSSGVSAIVQILQYLSDDDALKSYIIWTMGSLGEVNPGQLMILAPAVLTGLILSIATIKPLNLLLFGEEYAKTTGINIQRSRLLLFASTALLAGTTTAFCGPIGFIGLAIPHATRMMIGNADHRILLPATILTGADVMLICDVISKINSLPINAITALIGIPIIMIIVISTARK